MSEYRRPHRSTPTLDAFETGTFDRLRRDLAVRPHGRRRHHPAHRPLRVTRVGARVLHDRRAARASTALWGVDHLVMPQHTDSDYTLGRKPAKIGDDAVSGLLSPNYEMMTTLTWVAGFTERVRARHRGRGAPDPQRGAQRPGAGHPRRLLRRPRASTASASAGCARKPRPWACRGTAGVPAARSTSRCCARSGAPRATWSSSTASSTTSRRWIPSPARCSARSRSSSAATPTSRSTAPGASATVGSRRRCRPSGSSSTGPRVLRVGRAQRAATRRRCSCSPASRCAATARSATCSRSTARSASTTCRSASTGESREETLDTMRDVAENVIPGVRG